MRMTEEFEQELDRHYKIYLLWRTFADPMHFPFSIKISQCCPFISGIERKEVYFLNASSGLMIVKVKSKLISNKKDELY